MSRVKTALFEALGLVDVPVENPNRCEDCIGEFLPHELWRLSDNGQCGQCGECKKVWDLDHLAVLQARGKPVLAEDGHTVINRPVRDSHNHFNVYWVDTNRQEILLERAMNFWFIKGFKGFYRAPLQTYRSAMSYSPRHREGRLIYMGLSVAYYLALLLAMIGSGMVAWISPELSRTLYGNLLSVWGYSTIAIPLLAHLKWGIVRFLETIPIPGRRDAHPCRW